MRRALSLASPGVGLTGDNPSVGCVIVRDGVVIAEARTADSGRPHAEERAVALTDARDATVYVTLEPCAKRSAGGASCSEMLIQAGVARVVIAVGDPHPLVAGAGIERLRAAGVEVEVGILADEGRALNAGFFAKWGAS
ncbi:MAG: riboflavin biosynthesis protein RibD [Caulobacteraceae bacterium]|nr:riboflavin biosynthesis protein RibD [Caulobacteraceae bacterium]